MSTDQCAQNPNGSLKDAKDIQWFHDKDDAQPLPPTTDPAQPLGRGLRNKATNRFSDAVAHERLGSDKEEDLGTFSRPPRHKCAAAAQWPNVSGGATPPLSSMNLFEILPVEESSDDGTFQSDSGSNLDSDSGDGSTKLESISNNKVQWAQKPLQCLAVLEWL